MKRRALLKTAGGFPTTETPASGSLTPDGRGKVSFSVDATPDAQYYRLEE